VWVKREINLHEADRPASASTHDEVPDNRKRLSQFRAEVGMGDGDESFSLIPQRLSMHVHRGRVMEKMGSQSLADCVRFAEKLGIRSSIA
jgi:hypothetical protein